MTRQQAVDFLLTNPYKLGHLLGFTRLTELHNVWLKEMIRGNEDKTLQAHRGSYKTTCVSIAIALIVVLLPNCKTLFMRKTDNDIKEVISQVKKILQSQQMRYFVQCIYGVDLKLATATANEISTNLSTDIRGASQLVGLGMGGSLTGKHFDRIFTDDIVNVQDRISKAERDRTKLIYQELRNIINRGGRIFNTGTPWHKEDAFSLMPNPEKYDCYSTGLMTDAEIAEIRGKMTASLFAANYELRHIASEDVIFDSPQTGADPALVEQGECHIDAAFYGEDYTAFTIMKKHDGKYYVYGRCWRKHVEDCYSEIIQDYERFMCRRVSLETNADKGMVGKELRNMGLRVSLYAEKMNKYLKIVTYLKTIWKDVVFVQGTDSEYINQICDFNENCEHDDAADSCASLARVLYKKKENTSDYVPIFM